MSLILSQFIWFERILTVLARKIGKVWQTSQIKGGIGFASDSRDGLMKSTGIRPEILGIKDGDANEFPLGFRLADNCDNTPTPYGYILTLAYVGSGSNKAQLMLGYTRPGIYYRTFFSGVWSEWITVSFT